jgi:pimeloyl-ACP methyl ester carboxylesterase
MKQQIPHLRVLKILLTFGSPLVATLFCASVSPAIGQVTTGVSLRGDCQARFEEYLKKPNAGHFFYVEDPASKQTSCGFSFEDPGEFDRYPSSAQVAFTFCQNGADERGIKARCELIARGSTILAPSYAEAQLREDAAGLVRDSMRCGQGPLGRWFWVERAFCDMPWHGPATARGVVIWNHGILGTVTQYAAPVPPVFRLLQARGWDVVKIARNNLGETTREQSLYRAVQRTSEEIAARRREGYTRIVLAGQSFGGYITLDTAESSKDIYGVVAMAPGVRATGGSGSLDASVTERTIGHLSAERLVLVFPRNDTMFGSMERGPGALKVLAHRTGSFLLLDEKYDIVDHGGGTTGKFAVTYGPCLVQYLTSPDNGKGPVRCEGNAAEQLSLVKELLPKHPGALRLVQTPNRTAQDEGQPVGSRLYGILEPSGEVVSFAIVDVDGMGPRAIFSSVSGWRRGGLYEFSSGAQGVTFRLAERGTVTVKGTTLTWTPAGSGASQTARLLSLPDR